MGALRRGLGLSWLLMACSSREGSALADVNLPPDTYRLDFSQYDDHEWPPGAVTFTNESLAFPFNLAVRSQLVRSPSADRFVVVNNRLPCQPGIDPSRNDATAAQGFAQAAVTPQHVVRLESVTLEGVPDPRSTTNEVCFAYRTSDAQWHGFFEPLPTTYDAATNTFKATLAIQADDVDIMGVVVYYGSVTSITYLASRDAG